MKIFSIVIHALFFNAVQWSIASAVEIIMHVDSEMPCLKSELLSGTVVIRNNGDKDIRLLKGTSRYPDMLVHEQIYLFPSIPVQKEEDILAGHGALGGQPSRITIKDQVDSMLQNPESTVLLKKGESLMIDFDNREISASILSFTRERIPFAAELYLPPNNWIPVEVRPPIVIACDAKIIPVATDNNRHKKGRNAVWVFRVRMDTNEFLCASSNFSTHRLLDIHPDDTVVFQIRRLP